MSKLIESLLSTEWQCLKNKTGMYKAITFLKCVMLLTLTCRNLSTDIEAITWLLHRLNSPRFSESLKCRNSQEIGGQGSGNRFFKHFSSDTAGYSKSRFEINFWKNASNKIIFQIFAFLIIAAGL